MRAINAAPAADDNAVFALNVVVVAENLIAAANNAIVVAVDDVVLARDHRVADVEIAAICRQRCPVAAAAVNHAR
jgi:hypothetical protein